MIEAIANIFRIPDLRKRVIFTFGVLAVLQIGKYVPIPGINPSLISYGSGAGGGGNLFSLIDLFAGGAFQRCSIFALGIMPYISASIILQLLTVSSPYLEELSKKGEEGRKKINQYTRYLTVAITAFQAFMLAFSFENSDAWGPIVYQSGWSFRLLTVFSMTAGTVIIMWMGELITERGIGNGISLIIFFNIVARVPDVAARAAKLLELEQPTFTPLKALAVFVMGVIVIAGVCLIQYGQRRVPIKRGRMGTGKMYGAQSNSYLPLRINTAGVIPVIFASAILILPATFLQFLTPLANSENFILANIYGGLDYVANGLRTGGFIYTILDVALIIFFCYFYTAITFNPKDVAENLQKYGSTIPGYSHGKRTEEYLTRILNRITLAGAIFLAAVAVVPDLMAVYLNIDQSITSLMGGTSIIIIVGVALDTVNQIENHLRVRNYDGFRKRGRVRGRSGM